MIFAMAGFAVEDMFLKSAGRTLPAGEILLIFGLGGMAVFLVLSLRRGDPLLSRAYLAPWVLVRSGFEVVGRLFYTLAFILTPLTTTTAILQAAPLVVVGGAAIFLGERVGWRRWAAILAGFAGVLVILRPGTQGYDALSLLAVAGMIGFAGRDLATRAAPPQLTNLQLGIAGFAMMAVAGALLSLWGAAPVAPTPAALAYLGGAIVFGVAAYYALNVAMRTGEVGVVTPFRYTRLLFALILGMAIFGERPDALTLLGSAVVVGSGLFTLLRARRRTA